MIPALPLFLILLVPLVHYQLSHGKKQQLFFWGLNFFLLPLATLNVPQQNVLGVAKFLIQNPQVKEVVSVESSMVLFPWAFVNQPIATHKVSLNFARETRELNCDKVVVVREDLLEDLGSAFPLKPIARFSPGFLEAIVVKTNPVRNNRRRSLILFSDPKCELKAVGETL